VGQPVRVVGYGDRDNTGNVFGTKFQVSTALIGFDSNSIDVGNGNRDSCYGDSGGPNFMTIGDAEKIVAVVSRGKTVLCGEGSLDARIDPSIGFLTQFLPGAANCAEPATP